VRLRQAKRPSASNANTPALTLKRTKYLPCLPYSDHRRNNRVFLSKQATTPASCCLSGLHSPSFPQHPSWHRPRPRRTHAALTSVRVVQAQPHRVPPASTSSGPSCYCHLTSQLALPHLPLQTFPATCSFTSMLAPPSLPPLALLPSALCLLQCLAGAWSQS
jgi:hypothetical protein